MPRRYADRGGGVSLRQKDAAFQPANAGGWDGTITELMVDGSALVSSGYLGGSQDDGVNGEIWIHPETVST